MNATAIPIEQLQQNVRPVVEQTLNVVRAAPRALATSTPGREKKRFAKFESCLEQELSCLEQELKNVDSIDLRIVVVVPVRAGKSPIIKAALGQDILPSCSAAITAISTEVVLTPFAGAPQLTFSLALLKAIRGYHALESSPRRASRTVRRVRP